MVYSTALLAAAMSLLHAWSGSLGLVYAQDVYDTFTVNCQPLTVQRRDPLVSPGVDLSDHVHSVIGGTAFSADLDPGKALASAATTCDKELDHSVYWVPQMYHITTDNKYELVTFKGSAVYYQNRACDYQSNRTSCPSYKTNFAAAFPEGLQMVAGDPSLRTFDDSDLAQKAVSHMCLFENPDEQGRGSEETNSLPLEQCSDIRSQVTFPSCWDGQNLDSADHKSHMSYPDPQYGNYNGGPCPASHPVALITLFYEFHFDTSPYDDRNFVFAQGDKTGHGFHGDFVNGWTDLQKLGDAHRTCTGAGGVEAASCSINVGADGTPGHAAAQDLESAAPSENIGLDGEVLDELPGGKVPTGETPMARKRSRVFPARY